MAWIGRGRSVVVVMVWAPLVPAGLVPPTAFCPGRGMGRVWAFETGDTAPTVTVGEARRGQARVAAADDQRSVRGGGRGYVGYHAS